MCIRCLEVVFKEQSKAKTLCIRLVRLRGREEDFLKLILLEHVVKEYLRLIRELIKY